MHLATKSISIDLITTNLPPQFGFGRALTPYCVKVAAEPDSEFPCSLTEGSAQLYLVNSGEGHRTLNNVSTENQLFTVSESNLSYVFLGDPQVLSNGSNIDFSASTIAINTQCKPITQQCHVIADSGSTVSFNCSRWFAFNLLDPPMYGTPGDVSPVVGTDFVMTLFNDSTMIDFLNSAWGANSTNPVWVGMAAIIDQIALASVDPNNGSYVADPNVVPNADENSDVLDTNTGLTFILLCNSTIYDATYTWANGSFQEFTKLTPSNDSMARVINAPQQEDPWFGYSYFVSGATLSVFSPTVEEMVQKMADLYSRTVLGLVAGSFLGSQNIAEQIRTQIIAAKIPYAPFYTLVLLNLLCAVIGLGIAILAISNRNTTKVTSLLTPWGVTAQAFEPVPETVVVQHTADLFQESREANANVVGVERIGASKNWRFRVWNSSNEA